ncbi:carbamoyltransferase family protein [Streptosporangium carneum]|uniref:Transferase n=1 Tax=Streptosporangium carneum TaxID=47481 RepID=A0A9W6HW85_9ACTN|nr:carbamoyltransferase C-terminal domain-containing protein [Streptosporangium carneum]GLK07487.1 transferase [Streptosporangium carneum]
MTEPLILGIAASHNGGACLLRGSEVLVAIQEERLARQKRIYLQPADPALSVSYCLDRAGVTVDDLDAVVVCTQEPQGSRANRLDLNPQLRPAVENGRAYPISHHYGHAVSAFCTSGYEDAAILVIDGLGSPWADLSDEERATCVGAAEGWESISIYRASGTEMVPVEKQLAVDLYVEPDGGRYRWDQPHTGMPRFRTLGGMYSAVSWQLFEHGLEGPGKTMSLAGLNEPSFPVSDFLSVEESGLVTFRDTVPEHFTDDVRWPERTDAYTALAASVQAALEHAVIALAERALALTGSTRLCFVGGVALNGIVNDILAKRLGPENVYVIPAAEDSGTAIGAAYAGLWRLGRGHPANRVTHDFHGAPYPNDVIRAEAESNPVVRWREERDPVAAAAGRVAEGQIVGWFRGGAEFGPRALGHRSIIADPRRAENKLLLNSRLKRREEFRPFAPAVLEEYASEWFDIEDAPEASPFMLRVAAVLPGKTELIPAVVHTDGTARVQTVSREGNPDFYRVIEEFHRLTGVPMLLNTSMNGRGEPIVERPFEAMQLAVTAPLDAVYFEESVIEPLETEVAKLTPRHVNGLAFIEMPGTEFMPLDVSRQYDHAVSVPTPWGPVVHRLDKQAQAVLEAVDGERTVAELGFSTGEVVRLQRIGLLEFRPYLP